MTDTNEAGKALTADERLLSDCLDKLAWLWEERDAARIAALAGREMMPSELNVHYVEGACEVIKRLMVRLGRKSL